MEFINAYTENLVEVLLDVLYLSKKLKAFITETFQKRSKLKWIF